MNRTKIFSAILAASLTSAVLYAAPAITPNGKTVTKVDAMAKADERFTKMDANNDGKLDAADKAAMVKEHFADMDADKNGAINEAEFVAAHEDRAEKRADQREMRMGQGGPGEGRGGHKGHRGGKRGGGMKMLAMADTNGDKSVTKAEFRAAAEARFAKADANGDGSISADERKAQRKGKWGQRPAMPAPADAG